jgi:hypothetical protein
VHLGYGTYICLSKSAVCRDRPRTLNELKTAITAYIRNISQADVLKVFVNKIKRVQACIDVRGHHFQWNHFQGTSLPVESLPGDITSSGHHFQRTSLPADITSSGHHFQWTSFPADITSRGHHFQWTSFPADITSSGHHFQLTSLPVDITSSGHHFQHLL